MTSTAITKTLRELTDKEKHVVNIYCSKGNYSLKKTAELLDLQFGEVKDIITRDCVRVEVEKRQSYVKKKFKMDEVDVLNRLWEEANNTEKGSNHNARITALVWIGKHLGMWQEKKEEKTDNTYTYNIINYDSGSQPKQLEKIVEQTIEQEEVLENVSVTKYS
jgi:predicted HTH domain antitoxin